jgi:hypothetical protein
MEHVNMVRVAMASGIVRMEKTNIGAILIRKITQLVKEFIDVVVE